MLWLFLMSSLFLEDGHCVQVNRCLYWILIIFFGTGHIIVHQVTIFTKSLQVNVLALSIFPMRSTLPIEGGSMHIVNVRILLGYLL